MTAETHPLSEELLERIRSRAADYDRRNAFFDDDLEEVSAAGYLRAFVPADRGGLGMSLRDVANQQQRLAGAAPATALAVNMHLVWTGVAKVLLDRGDTSLHFVLDGAAAGQLYAFGISEAGNDLVLFGSDTAAVPDEHGGYRFFGTKIFTSLSPAWTSLGTMGLDTTSADAPKVVYGFVGRDEHTTSKDDWDAVGMRASQSRSTVLDGSYAPADRVVRRLAPGPNPDPFIFGIFACFEILLASVYTGIGARAVDLAVESARSRTSKRTGQTLANDPDIRWRVADAVIAHEAIGPQIDTLANDVDNLVDHGSLWFPRLSSLKHRATETARIVVDQAIRVSGGSSYFSSSELGRLYRDVLAGIFHPSDAESVHSAVARAWLGPVQE
ncbi:acyl-CoA dehydrogenase family protein [Okibacterium endophyticum]